MGASQSRVIHTHAGIQNTAARYRRSQSFGRRPPGGSPAGGEILENRFDLERSKEQASLLERYKKQAEEAHAECEHLTRIGEQLKNQVETLQAENQGLSQQYDDLSQQYGSLLRQHQDLQANFGDMQRQLSELEQVAKDHIRPPPPPPGVGSGICIRWADQSHGHLDHTLGDIIRAINIPASLLYGYEAGALFKKVVIVHAG